MARPLYDSHKNQSPLIDEFQALMGSRSILYVLVYRDFVSRYKKSVLGAAWMLLNPIATMLVIALVFSHLFGRMEGYPVYVLSGLVPYMFFSEATSKANRNILWGGGLLKRIYLPKAALILSTILSSTINFLIMLIPLFVMAWYWGRGMSPALIYLPIGIINLFLFSLGVGLFISSITTFYADGAELYQVILRLWFYITPIIWPRDMLPEYLTEILFYVNPLMALVEIFHSCFYYDTAPSLLHIGYSTGMALLALLVGWGVFALNSSKFSYRI